MIVQKPKKILFTVAQTQCLSLRGASIHIASSVFVFTIASLLVRFYKSENNQSKIIIAIISSITFEHFSKSSLLFVYIVPLLENIGLDVIT